MTCINSVKHTTAMCCAVSCEDDAEDDEEDAANPSPAPLVFSSMHEVEAFWDEQSRYVSDVCSIDDGSARQLLKEHGHDADAAIQDFLVNVRPLRARGNLDTQLSGCLEGCVVGHCVCYLRPRIMHKCFYTTVAWVSYSKPLCVPAACQAVSGLQGSSSPGHHADLLCVL